MKKTKRLQPEGKTKTIHPTRIRISDLSANKVKACLQENDDADGILQELVDTGNATFELLLAHSDIPVEAKNAFWQLQRKFNVYSALLIG